MHGEVAITVRFGVIKKAGNNWDSWDWEIMREKENQCWWRICAGKVWRRL